MTYVKSRFFDYNTVVESLMFKCKFIFISQGIPFFHAGDEMLRSKSLDRDSYNSGDWFNRFTTKLSVLLFVT